jgi:hypothetical protein
MGGNVLYTLARAGTDLFKWTRESKFIGKRKSGYGLSTLCSSSMGIVVDIKEGSER